MNNCFVQFLFLFKNLETPTELIDINSVGEVHTINNDHGLIIIINQKQYLYMSTEGKHSLTETDVNMLFSSIKRYIPHMSFKKLSRLNVENCKYIGMIEEDVFSVVFPESKFQKNENTKIVISDANFIDIQRL